MSDKQHPTKSALLAAVKTRSRKIDSHLADCPECSIEFDILKQVFPDGVIPEVEKPEEAHLAQLATIPARRAKARDRSTVRGTVAFDSWSGLTRVQVRGAARGAERRLRLSAGRTELELVAGRQLTGWEFSARGYVDGEPCGDFLLKVGGKTLSPEYQNCFFWNSTRPPRTIHLLSSSHDLVFKDISWAVK